MSPIITKKTVIELGDNHPSDKEKQAIRACFYHLGINPLPSLRRTLRKGYRLEWEDRKETKAAQGQRLWSLRIYTEGLNRRSGFVTLYQD